MSRSLSQRRTFRVESAVGDGIRSCCCGDSSCKCVCNTSKTVETAEVDLLLDEQTRLLVNRASPPTKRRSSSVDSRSSRNSFGSKNKEDHAKGMLLWRMSKGYDYRDGDRGYWTNGFREFRHSQCLMTPISLVMFVIFAAFSVVGLLFQFPMFMLGLLVSPVLARSQMYIQFLYPWVAEGD